MKEIRQNSLVAFFGEKTSSSNFWSKIKELQIVLENRLNNKSNNYIPYEIEKIHGTIIGLEAAKIDNSIVNKNYLEIQSKIFELDLESILNYLNKSELLPFEVKIGGFENKEYLFTSRGASPYERSFSVQKEIIVAMGWPFSNNSYNPVLDTIRRRLSTFGGLHKYHAKPDSFDNDLFFVLGNLKEELTKKDSIEIKNFILDEMKTWKNTFIKIDKTDLGIVSYKDTQFKNNPIHYSLDEAMNKIDELKSFYPKYFEINKNKNWLKE